MSKLNEYLEKVYIEIGISKPNFDLQQSLGHRWLGGKKMIPQEEEEKSCGGKKPAKFKTKIKNDKELGDKWQTVEISSAEKRRRKNAGKKKEERPYDSHL